MSQCLVSVESDPDVPSRGTGKESITSRGQLDVLLLVQLDRITHVDRHEFQDPILCQHTENHFFPCLIVRINQWESPGVRLDEEFASFKERSHRVNREERWRRYPNGFLDVYRHVLISVSR